MLDEIILKRTQDANKTYAFTDNSNPKIISEYWFQQTPAGKLLFLVFYTQACRYSKCTGCNLPSKMSQHHIGYLDLMEQVDYVFSKLLKEDELNSINKIIVSNNGSVLDEDTFSTTALMYLIARVNQHCPNVSEFSLETRPEYVDMEELEVLSRALQEGNKPTSLELCIGFEAYDEKIRNEQFMKGLNLINIEELADKINKNNSRFKEKYKESFSPMKLKTYFMLKPVVDLNDEDAIKDVHLGIDYLDHIAKKYNIDVNMHLNPTYVAKGTSLEEAFNKGLYTPPTLEMTKNAVLHGKAKQISIYVGLFDEGLAVEGGSFIKDTAEDKELLKALKAFNETQDYLILEN